MASSFEELIGLGSYAGNHASQGRVSVLNLQEVTGTTAFDSGGLGNHGTFVNMGSNPVSVAGPKAWLPNAVSFDGTNDYVDYGGEVASLDDWTIACWFRTTQTGNDRWIMSEGSTASNTPGIGIVVQSGNLRCFCRGSVGTVNLITSKTVNDGNWHFAQFSRSGTDFYVYCDGELITSGGSPVDNPATNISGIGCFRRASASLFAQAQIAGVYKFSRMLSLSEHQFLFAGPEGGDDPIEASLSDVEVPLEVESATPTTEFEATLPDASSAIQVESATPTTSFVATLHDIVISPEVESVTASAGQLATLGIVSQLIEAEAMVATTAYTVTLHDIELPLAVEHAEPSFTEIPQTNLSDLSLLVEVEQMTPAISYTASLYDISLPLEVFSDEATQPTTGNVFGLKTASGYFFLKV